MEQPWRSPEAKDAISTLVDPINFIFMIQIYNCIFTFEVPQP